ncbi:hypothetical protein AG4045_008103 [Apium graveolens]|uniref:Uncharacterized protein n=1 Tax=Apium graveolens TaxID=4045 RepID=A0A6L5BCD6_APIGR|nr:hypothetical protein AG4045_008103 [Apium graveolens]
MDLYSIGLSYIPIVIGSLLELRYIAVCIKARDNDSVLYIPKSVLKLKYLETLIIQNKHSEGIHVPKEIWMSCRLRHLILKGNISAEEIKSPYLSGNLQTLSHIANPFAPYIT